MAVGLATSVGDDAKACNDCRWKRRLQPAAIRNSGGLTKFLGAIYFGHEKKYKKIWWTAICWGKQQPGPSWHWKVDLLGYV
jgi:hypothetical protein